MPTVENSRIGLDDWLKNHIRSKLRKKINKYRKPSGPACVKIALILTAGSCRWFVGQTALSSCASSSDLTCSPLQRGRWDWTVTAAWCQGKRCSWHFHPSIVVNRFTLMHKRHEYQIKSGQLSTTLHNSSIKNIKIFFVRLSNWNL